MALDHPTLCFRAGTQRALSLNHTAMNQALPSVLHEGRALNNLHTLERVR